MGVFQRVVREAWPQDYSHYRPDTRIDKSHIDDLSQVILNVPHPDEYDPALNEIQPNDPTLTNGPTNDHGRLLVGIGIGGFVTFLILVFLCYLLYNGCRNMMSNVTTKANKANLKKHRDRDQGSPQTQRSNLSFNEEVDMTLKRRESIPLPVPPHLESQNIRPQIIDFENASLDDFPENIPPLPVQPHPISPKPMPLEEELPKSCPDFYTNSTLIVGDHRGRQGQVIRGEFTRKPSTSGQGYGKARLPIPPPPPIDNSTASSTSGNSRRPSGGEFVELF